MNRQTPGLSREQFVVRAGGSLILTVLVLGRLFPAMQRVDESARASWAESVSARHRYEFATAQLRRAASTPGADAGAARLEGAVIAASSEADAFAALILHVSAIAELCDVSIASATPLTPGAPVSDGRRIAARFAFFASTRATFDLLRELDVGSPVTAIKSVRIVAEHGGGATGNDRVVVEMVVESPVAIRAPASDA